MTGAGTGDHPLWRHTGGCDEDADSRAVGGHAPARDAFRLDGHRPGLNNGRVWRGSAVAQLRMPVVPDGDVAAFYARLHALHAAAGQPSMRELQRRTRAPRRPSGINPTTVHDAFAAPRLARWEVVAAVVTA